MLQALVRTHVLGITPSERTRRGGPEISGREIGRILRHQFGDVAVFTTDETYQLVDPDEFQDFLMVDETDERIYMLERNDCDDYAQILQGKVREYEYDRGHNYSWAVGMAFGPKKTDSSALHAYNFMITTDRSLYLVEPQSDEVLTPERSDWLIQSAFC